MDFLSNNSSLISDGRFSITDTESGFGVSISNVSPQDAGVYWCGQTTPGLTGVEQKAVINNTTSSSSTNSP
uniref:Immunoglobulin V-set domain-containing protein n=1 Tax=Stegastes partitus TaxID=144197 RepID=A0A3B5A8I0_9TELE